MNVAKFVLGLLVIERFCRLATLEPT